VSEPYEPGSTFKMVTAAAVLSHRLLTPNDMLDCGMGGITLAGQLIRDHHPFGQLSMRQVLAKSSNVGMVKLALMLGDQRLYDEIRGFGFGERSGIDLPGESPGIVRPLRAWGALSKAYVSFGQEVSVTPLQLARAMSAVANGGRLLRPHVVASVESESGVEHLDEPFEQGWSLTPSVASELTELLQAVVQDGTGKAAAVEGYGVAGKTGTAQKVIGGRYSHREFIASFVGFAPIGAPRLVGLVALDEPWPIYYGGQVAAPAFSAIAKQVLLYWGVPPQPAPALASPAVPGDALEVGPLVLAANPSMPSSPAEPTAVSEAVEPGGTQAASGLPGVDVVEEPVYSLEGLPATGWSGGGRR
jgi:cell division protein FtsI (penicillin-binding protein 3)